MKKKKIIIARLPLEAVEILRHKGGAQSSQKGKRGYARKKEKENFRRERLALD